MSVLSHKKIAGMQIASRIRFFLGIFKISNIANQLNCYKHAALLHDLMDAPYDAEGIHAFSRAQGHVPIIDANARKGEKTPFAPAEKQRYAQRSSAERTNSALKDSYGARFVRVRSAAKVMTHLMFGVQALAAAQIVGLLD